MANQWTSFNNLPGGFQPDTMILLTDGSVLVHNASGKDWRRLTPDAQGKYESGAWSAALNMTNTREYFASGVLMDGRVFAIGGEYSDAGGDTPLGEVFDPLTNTWAPLNKPASFNWIQGDVAGCILADGRVLLGAISSSRTAIWDPVLDTWTEAGLAFGASTSPTKAGRTNEETWTLLPDGTVLTVEVFNPPQAEKYLPSLDRWVSAGNTLSTLPLGSLADPGTPNTINISEIGPAVVLPDGRLFAIGGTGRTALYTPPNDPTQPGAWANGPNTPADTSGNNYNQANGNFQTAIDAPGCLLPNGKVLLVAGNTKREVNNGAVQFWSNPSICYLYDPATNGISQLNPQPPSNTNDTWTANLLLLPTGQVLFSSQQGALAILTLDPANGVPNAAWKPTITNAPSTLVAGHTYVIAGTQFNGLSQACSYGDDAQIATNYPIVRLTDLVNNRVFYLRSFNFSSLGIATGSAPQTASIQVPAGVLPGQYQMVVIANGIASNSVNVQVVAQDCFFIVDRSTYGQGEIAALINLNGAPAKIDPALYVVVEGFKSSDLGLTQANLGNPPNKPSIPSPVNGVTFEFSGPVIPEDPSLPPNPQRFTFPYRIVFQNATTIFNFGPDIEPLTLQASLTAAGTTVASSAGIELIKNPNPFILHGDTAHGYPWYLSVDTRVFQMKAGQTQFAVSMGTTGAARDVATTFIQQVISNLNNDPGSAGGLFDALPQNEDAASLALAPNDVHGTPVYNFALARVRYRDVIPATNVRVFFRMWPAQQTNATYDTSTLYPVGTNGASQKVPTLGVGGDEIMTIPFFATQRVDASTVSMATQTDTHNIRATINPSALGGEVASYYGCWLDINQSNDGVFPARIVGLTGAAVHTGPFTGMGPLLPIQQLVRSQHQCLIAEVSFDPDPIPSNADPSNSDKLAQRNLTFVNVPNPGLTASRRAPQTFEVRPTPGFLAPDQKPDELMIEWGSAPAGSRASIYLPAVDADEMLRLAGEMYSSHQLMKTDAHTLECPTGGVTYVPIPKGSGVNFAGLLTVSLPNGIRKGEVHQISVKQITGAFRRGDEVIEEIPVAEGASYVKQRGNLQWRRVLGVFRLTIPVSTREALLAPEERLLSVLRWIEQAIPLDSRWYLVFRRYVEQVAGRVQDMGGDPTQIGPDPDGRGHKRHHHHEPEGEKLLAFSGKLSGLVYDRFGDFSGFLLDTEDGERHFESRAPELEELVRRAWKQRIRLIVYAERHDPDHAQRIVLRGPVHHLEE